MQRPDPTPIDSPGLSLGGPATDPFDPSPSGVKWTTRMPKDVGMLLVVVGITGGVLPPPPGPFDLMVVLSGGLILWPRGFQSIDGWAGRQFPSAHRMGRGFLDRFVVDLERRYPTRTSS